MQMWLKDAAAGRTVHEVVQSEADGTVAFIRCLHGGRGGRLRRRRRHGSYLRVHVIRVIRAAMADTKMCPLLAVLRPVRVWTERSHCPHHGAGQVGGAEDIARERAELGEVEDAVAGEVVVVEHTLNKRTLLHRALVELCEGILLSGGMRGCGWQATCSRVLRTWNSS